MIEKVNILGINIDNVTESECVETIRQALREKKNKKIFTPNTSIVLSTVKDNKMNHLINSADLLIADGIGLVQASKILNDPLPQRIAGIDMGEKILEIANGDRLSLFLLGGTKESVSTAANKIRDKYRNIKICGIHHGFFDINSEYNQKLIKAISSKEPDIMFVCMGYPKQELWICQNVHKIPSLRLSIGLGGSLDVWSGKVKRAPVIFRKLNMEWLWRMIIQPQRLKNLSDIPCFYYCILKQKLNLRQIHLKS